MRVYISADLEGISGVVNGVQTGGDGPEYQRARRLMTAEVNAAIEGALAAGAAEVVVNDSHGGMRNILIEELNPAAKLITGTPKPLVMMEGVQDGFDAVFFIGYHARAGTPGILNHTISGRAVANIRVDGQDLGETGINALIAGYYGAPVVMVSGDSNLAAEARDFLGNIEAVAVKEANGRFSACCLSTAAAAAAIKEGAIRALERLGEFQPKRPPRPASLELTFFSTAMADMAENIPGTVRVNPLTVSFTHEDYIVAFRAIRAMIGLAGTL
ncbi:MAG: M55 family metallopeptidase [Bacillota bacterium]